MLKSDHYDKFLKWFCTYASIMQGKREDAQIIAFQNFVLSGAYENAMELLPKICTDKYCCKKVYHWTNLCQIFHHVIDVKIVKMKVIPA